VLVAKSPTSTGKDVPHPCIILYVVGGCAEAAADPAEESQTEGIGVDGLQPQTHSAHLGPRSTKQPWEGPRPTLPPPPPPARLDTWAVKGISVVCVYVFRWIVIRDGNGDEKRSLLVSVENANWGLRVMGR
jgi:hypothetical protein